MGEQRTTLSQSIDTVSDKEKYDAACKKILAEKIILAWIMKYTVKEYADYEVQEIAQKYIEGTPQVAQVAILPDETNASRVIGTGVEDSSVTEGMVTYDIQFRAILPVSGETTEMIINLEAQNDFYPGYPIVKRGIYYCSRMISSQYGTVFTRSHYEKIQKVYSIWICMTPPDYRKNTITQYSMQEENVIGAVEEEKEHYDLLTTIIICLGNYEHHEEDNDLLKLLDVLLSSDKKAVDKKRILEDEFGIPMTEELEGEMEKMCNLSEGVERRGIEKGLAQGIEQGIEQTRRALIIDMLKENESIDKICRYAKCDEMFVLQVIKGI